jgi:putative ABC transport system permease protein
MKPSGVFALAAVVLSAIGVYGVLAAFVVQRSRELGVRAALGASVGDLRRHVFTQLARPAILGLAVGTATALAASRFLQPMLFDIRALDAPAYAVGWLTLGLAGAAGALGPLRRAGRVDPAALLRSPRA